jgi:RNA polymerase sigma-70 factor (ECF subfamily)
MDRVDQLEAHRVALTGHCYRMLGSAVDAEDAVQETLIRAWRGLDSFDGRASLKNWLYRISTNVCLDALAARKRHRARPVEDGPLGTPRDDLNEHPGEYWIEPVADARAIPSDATPAEHAILKQSIRLAFVAALQHLPAKQRAALLMVEVLGWSAAETAGALDLTTAAVNSALQRARATLLDRRGIPLEPLALSESQSVLVDRYAAAFEDYDIEALTALMLHDATLSMPPYSLWLQGHAAIREWLLGRGCGCRDSILLRVEACGGSPSFGQYRPDPATGGFKPWALIVLELEGEKIAAMNSFLDTEALFPLFELPSYVPAPAA